MFKLIKENRGLWNIGNFSIINNDNIRSHYSKNKTIF